VSQITFSVADLLRADILPTGAACGQLSVSHDRSWLTCDVEERDSGSAFGDVHQFATVRSTIREF
jgi:hypothetical protein